MNLGQVKVGQVKSGQDKLGHVEYVQVDLGHVKLVKFNLGLECGPTQSYLYYNTSHIITSEINHFHELVDITIPYSLFTFWPFSVSIRETTIPEIIPI